MGRTTKLFRTSLPVFALMLITATSCLGQVFPLANAFSHNDYLRKKPLYEALDNGFTNIEADIFLINDKLIVAHYFPYFKSKRTLEALYLKPLADYIKNNKGAIYSNYQQPITLMIDIKTGADKTYAALKPLLAKYSSLLTSYDNGVIYPGLITIVLSGNRPVATIQNETKRYAFVDDRLNENTAKSTDVYLMSSCKYSRFLHWAGKGTLSEKEDAKFKMAIEQAHAEGKKVRLYAAPENKAVWRYLLASGVDMINTDQLATLKTFLTGAGSSNLQTYQSVNSSPVSAAKN
ncbi:Glycerophosphoryl diester phosphodiesterase [Mucilaginibacter pineti]|uniref:Altered inheritance of mitochondria protein 6 n=1 Tax=Mucilaginibacter pineti TaxID=1391627 RepID=A0A1G7LQU7_9SPHI|nr:phosphatidylinositol-specific phospholipase C/glycerophosphodiester phosphodiesterase family protein [Mucilaginibacter pineti]SDF51734.1 Glycerophosphoryl diester phosphodiesterase [Mucilaginibacter pineti]